MKKAKKPCDFNMPHSQVTVAEVGTSFDRYVQFFTSGTYEPKTIRRFAAWLLKAADWMEQARRVSKVKT